MGANRKSYSPEMIAAAKEELMRRDMAQKELNKRDKEDRYSKVSGLSPSIPQEIAGGALHGLQGLLKMFPDLHNVTPESMHGSLPHKQGEAPIEKFDAYEALGTKEKPWNSIGGAAQTAGELFMPGKVVEALRSEKLAGPAKEGFASLKDYFSPGKHAKDLMQKMGGGAKNMEDIGKSASNDIRQGFLGREAEVKPYFDMAFEHAGEKRLFEAHNPLISSSTDKEKAMIDKLQGFHLGKVFDAFKKDPNFRNAHDVQSELGHWVGDLKRTPHKTPEQRKELNHLVSVRNELKKDIGNLLDRHDSTSNLPIKNTYNKGIELYREHVAPYLSSESLRDLTKGGEEYIKDVHKIFEHPTGKVDKAGKLIRADVEKLLEDMPPEMREKILFSRLGAAKHKKNPMGLVEEARAAKNEGYSKYFSDDLNQQLRDITAKHKHQGILKKLSAGGTLSGLIAGGYGLHNANKARHGEE
jgi:hypothetical protein